MLCFFSEGRFFLSIGEDFDFGGISFGSSLFAKVLM